MSPLASALGLTTVESSRGLPFCGSLGLVSRSSVAAACCAVVVVGSLRSLLFPSQDAMLQQGFPDLQKAIPHLAQLNQTSALPWNHSAWRCGDASSPERANTARRHSKPPAVRLKLHL